MKKTILATAILLAGAANAAEVYNNEGTTVSLGGSFRGHVAIDSSDEVNFEDAGSRFDIKAAKELDNGLKAFGQMEIKYKDVDSLDTLYVNNAFLGLEHDVYGKLILGKKLGLNDDLVMNDFSYENGVYNHQSADAGSDTQDQLEYTKAFGGASVVVGLIDQDTYSIGGTYEVAGLSLGVAYNIKNDAKVGATNATSDNSALIVGAQYSLDALTLGVQYQALEVNSADISAYGFGAHYAIGQAGVYAMYDILDGDAKSDEGSELVVGADYEIAKDVKTYAEFNTSDNEVTGSDNTLWLGARVYF
ncbi:porin [Moritella sp. Urea-trap-13]|uniref:porin n=1 Tax=Moritella sp. Urea-trap-13 TaxID=2058327 RepID=UPI000C341504|nr:porin [Moritella sp. Urea-trap-13]PKH07987.1 porin [Moritella sp. Urea-trap-13]